MAHTRPVVDAPLREGRRFPAPFWIEEDEPAPLPGVPPEREATRRLSAPQNIRQC